MGLEISVTKLRRFVWAATGSSAMSCPDMTIRGLHWEPTPIPAASNGCLTYLGGLYDLERRDITALKEIKDVAINTALKSAPLELLRSPRLPVLH